MIGTPTILPAFPGDIAKAKPRTLYVCRYVENAKEIIDWAKGQGFKTVLKPEDLHVTIAHSKMPVDWMTIEPDWGAALDGKPSLVVPAGGPRLVEPLGDKGAVVLLFKNWNIESRHKTIEEKGARWSFPQYQPHITITWDAEGMDLSKVEPFNGEIKFGPEVFAEVNENWSDNITEKSLAALTKFAPENDDEVRIVKVDKALGLVFGWAIVCKQSGKDYYDLNIDSNGKRVPEHIPEGAMLEAASDFMQKSRVHKEMHSGDARGTVVFAFPLTTDIAKAMGIETKNTGLLVAMKPDAEMLAKYASGELTGFSIGGSRVKVREHEENA
jgi:hypothetical protein